MTQVKEKKKSKPLTDDWPVTSSWRIQVDSACWMIAIQIHTFVLCSMTVLFSDMYWVPGCSLFTGARERFKITSCYSSFLFLRILLFFHSTNREADDVQMTWKGSWIKLKLANQTRWQIERRQAISSPAPRSLGQVDWPSERGRSQSTRTNVLILLGWNKINFPAQWGNTAWHLRLLGFFC